MTFSIYSDGTVSVTNGDATVAGSGTAWAVSGIAGGSFSCNGLSIPIASVTDDATLVLAYAWPGSTASAQVYAIQRENSVASNIVDVYDKLTQVLRQLALAGIHPSAAGTITDRDALTLGTGDKDFIFLYVEIGFDLAFYRWSGTAWQGPFAVKGATGATGPAGLIGVWRGDWLTATAYAVNDAVADSGSSYICATAHTSGTFATDLAAGKWELVAQKGAQGDPGADGTGTGDVVGPGSAVADNIATYNGTTGKLVKDSGVAVSSLAPKASPTLTGTVTVPDGSFAPAKLDNGAATSILGRSANSSGARADIAAGSDDTILRRVSSALGFGRLTAGMVPAELVTYAMLASAAIASNSEFQLGTASKLLSAAALKSTVAYQALTDAATISWDMSLGNNGSVALAGNRTMGNPTNANPLFGFVLKVTATTSSRTLSLGANYVVAAGVEAFPITIATTETIFVCGFVDTSSRIIITSVIRT